MSRLTRPQRQRAALAQAIPEDELIRSLHDLISVVVSVPEADRGQWFRSMERFISHPQPGTIYDLNEPGKLWLRLARATWKAYPEQDLNMTPRSVAASAPGAGYRFPAPGRGSS